MNDEFDGNETVHITGGTCESTRFFKKMMKDFSILGQIPKGSTIEIVSNEPGNRTPNARQWPAVTPLAAWNSAIKPYTSSMRRQKGKLQADRPDTGRLSYVPSSGDGARLA